MAQSIDYIEVGSGSRVKARWWRRSLTKWQIKVYLSVVGVVIVAAVLLYTQNIVNQLIERERQAVTMYAAIFENFIKGNSGNANDVPGDVEYLFLLRDKITPTINFPCIVTDEHKQPMEPVESFMLNVDYDTTISSAKRKELFARMITQMESSYPPIEVKDASGKTINYVFYTNSVLVRRLRILPYVEIIIVGVFIGIGYLAFNYLKRNEESNIWVGMAKEAAHQLGTPLSSMLAWIELLKLNRDDGASFDETLSEMEHDVDRLKTIANRFSLIGSEPKLKPEHPAKLIEDVCAYFERRFPHLGKHVHVERELDQGIRADINAELFSWVFENLIKNAAEAIEVKEGHIHITLRQSPSGEHILMEVSDNGKGMSTQVRKQIFNPGFTTKKRGWGLGLSLSKRIIEEYHKGKIVVRHSAPGEGTVFAIEVPIHTVELAGT